MKLTFETKKLAAAVKAVMPAVAQRSPKEILSCVRIDAGDGVGVSATNLAEFASVVCDAEREGDPGDIVMRAEKLNNILRVAADTHISFRTTKSGVAIASGRAEWTAPTHDPDEFPGAPSLAEKRSAFDADVGALRSAIKATEWSCEQNSTRYAMGGVRFHLGPWGLRLEASDGKVLCRSLASANSAEEVSAIATLATLRLMDGSLPASGNVHLAFDANHICALADRVTIRARQLEGRFPKTDDVFTHFGSPKFFHAVASSLLRTIEQAAVATDEDHIGVRLTFDNGNVRVSAVSPSAGSADADHPIDYAMPAQAVLLDPYYLTQVLKVIGEDVVEIALRQPKGGEGKEVVDGVPFRQSVWLRSGAHDWIIMGMAAK